MSFFGTERQLRQANAASNASLPTGFAENLEAQWRAGLVTGRTNGDLLALHDVYDQYLEALGDDGRELGNPVALEAQPGIAAFSTVERAEEFFRARLEAKGIQPRSGEDLRAEARALAAQRLSEAEEVSRQATDLGAVGGFIGGAGAVVTDPPVLGTMLLGAPVSAGILRTAATEALIAGGTEIAIQPLIAASREELGQPLTLDEALDNVLFATIGGAAFGGTFKAIGTGFKKTRAAIRSAADDVEIQLPDTAEVRDAAAFNERYTEMVAGSPFNEADLEGPSEHIRRFDEAMTAGREGRAANIPPDSPVPVRRDILETPPPGRPSGNMGQLGEQIRDIVTAERLAEDDLQRPLERARIEAQRGDIAQAQSRLNALEDQLRSPTAQPKPQRLASFLKQAGGLRDEAGDLREALDITPRQRPGLINNRGGKALDEAAAAAREAGFFPGRREVTGDDLVQALKEDVSGSPRVREADQADAEAFREAQALARELERRGIAIDDIPRGELGRTLVEATRAQDEISGAVQTGQAARAEFERLEEGPAEFDRAVEASVLRDLEALGDDVPIDLDDSGNPITARQMLDDIAEEESAVNELSDCILGGVANAG